ncbi:MAG: hypothetical protein HY817_05795 [Candidatus Abawacabacteria bacterium]|nr:hypothetical protein [Candidatus Abawacabacteria bacterium]
MINILSAVESVVNSAKEVKINYLALSGVANSFQMAEAKSWLHDAPFDFSVLSEEEMVNFLFLFYALIFCFWGEPKWAVTYQEKSFDGSFGLLIALRRAKEEGVPVFDWNYWATISQHHLATILRGNVEIPLFSARLDIMHEVGKGIEDNWQGNIANLIQAAQHDAQELLLLISNNFPSFRDVAQYQGRIVPFYKRAQLFIVDIYQFLENKGLGNFSNIKTITALADYKLPQTLRHLGILQYTPKLASIVDSKNSLPHGAEAEVEIRAATVWAVELLRRELAPKFPTITATVINDYLWLMSQSLANTVKPYHRTLNIYY